MNVWNPAVTNDQFSTAVIRILNGPINELNIIQAGWAVSHDYILILYIYRHIYYMNSQSDFVHDVEFIWTVMNSKLLVTILLVIIHIKVCTIV